MEKVQNEEKVMPKIMTDNAPAEFRAIADIDVTTTKECCKAINSLFKGVFADWVGSTIEVRFVQEKGHIAPKLHFTIKDKSAYETELPANKFWAFIPKDYVNGGGSQIVSRLNKVTGLNGSIGCKVDLTPEAKSILEDFILGDPKRFDWKSCYSVKVTPDGIDIEVFKLDINKIIKKYYGEKDLSVTYTSENGTEKHPKFFYSVSPIDALPVYPGQIPDNWKMSIMRLSEKNLRDGAALLGWGSQYNSNIVTETY